MISLNSLAPAAQTEGSGDNKIGSSEQELMACLMLIIGCTHMLPAVDDDEAASIDSAQPSGNTLGIAIRIVLNADLTNGNGSELQSPQFGGALRCLVHLFLPVVKVGGSLSDIDNSRVTTSSSSWQGHSSKIASGSNVHMLSMRQYRMPLGGDNRNDSVEYYVSGGYFKSAYLYLGLGLASVDDHLPMAQGRGEAAATNTTVASKALRRLCGVFGSDKLSMEVILQLWDSSLQDVELNIFQDKLSNKSFQSGRNHDDSVKGNESKKKNRRREKRISSECGALQWAIGTTEFLHFTLLGLIESLPTEDNFNGFEVTENLFASTNDISKKRIHSCALCGKHGHYQASSTKGEDKIGLDDKKLSSTLLRCSRCQTTYYCSKAHQKKHWGSHRTNCKAASPSSGATSDGYKELNNYASPNKLKSENIQKTVYVARHRLMQLCSQVVKRATTFLKSYLRFTASTSLSVTSPIRMSLVSTILEVTGTIFFTIAMLKQIVLRKLSSASNCSSAPIESMTGPDVDCDEVILLQDQLRDFERCGKLLMLDILSPLLSLAVDSSSPTAIGISSANISRQAAMTTLSRISLYMGYKSGPDMLRQNLDYIVDAVCLYLQQLKRSTKHAINTSHTGEIIPHRGMNVVPDSHLGHEESSLLRYDARIVKVVGSVLEAILNDKNTTSNSESIDMLLRDMVSETLSTIDMLSAMATATSVAHQALNTSLLIQVGPLLDLMHSLVRTTVKPLEEIPGNLLTLLDRNERSTNEITNKQEGKAYKGLFSTTYFQTEIVVPDCLSASRTIVMNSNDEHKSSTDHHGALNNIVQSLVAFSQQWSVSQKDKIRQHQDYLNELDSGESFSFPEADDDAGLGEAKDEEEEDSEPPSELELIVKVLEKCHYFMACTDLSAQVCVINVMISGFSRLAKCKKLCLPALHKAWPSIMTRIKELRALYVLYHHHHHNHHHHHSGDTGWTEFASIHKLFLLPHLLQLVTLLAFLCGDFVSMKFKEDLWPELMVILHIFSQEVVSTLPQSSSIIPHASGQLKGRTAKASPSKRESWASLDDSIFKSATESVVVPALALDIKTNGNAEISESKSSEFGSSYALKKTSKFSLLEKLKSSLLTCLMQLSCMTIRDINVGPMMGSCLAGDSDSDLSSERDPIASNPLRPIAPLCIWLLLPLLTASHPQPHDAGSIRSSEGQYDADVLFKTMLHLSQLDASFAVGLFDTLSVMIKTTNSKCTLAEAQQSPFLAWEGLRSHPTLADSYTVLNKQYLHLFNKSSSLSSGQVLQRLLGSRSLHESDVLERLVASLTSSK